LLQALVSRVVVKPWDGQNTGIGGGEITIAPQIGTKRYLVKISLSESSLLSGALSNSVDGSTLSEKWLGEAMEHTNFSGPSGCGLLSASRTLGLGCRRSASVRFGSGFRRRPLAGARAQTGSRSDQNPAHSVWLPRLYPGRRN
jgi:hypothetical protein